MHVLSYVTDLKDKLFKDENWKEIELTRQWTSTVPSKAGVYVLKSKGEIVYVGETSTCLSKECPGYKSIRIKI